MSYIQQIDEKVIIIKTHEKTLLQRGTLYEAIHKWWDLNKARASRAEYVLAVIRESGEIVQEVYEVIFSRRPDKMADLKKICYFF